MKVLYAWLVVLCLLALGIIPYKWPVANPDINTPNKLLVSHHECTCCASFSIEKGELIIPDSLKHFLTQYHEISVEGNTPFNDSYYNIWQHDFVIEGEVVGVDSSCLRIENVSWPIFKISKWLPLHYAPNYLSFGKVKLLVYLSLLIVAIISSIVLTVLLLIRKFLNAGPR